MCDALNTSLVSATNATDAGSGAWPPDPSTPLCIGLSAFGGFLEVSSTMCLAYPEYRVKMGAESWGRPCFQKLMMVLNLSLMAVASVVYIAGSWFGPVTLSVPTVMISKLLFNMVLMGLVLRMANFTKDQHGQT